MQVFDLRWLNAPLTLDCFEEDRNHVGPGSGDFFERMGVIKRHTNEPGDQGGKSLLNLGVTCGRQRCERASMKSVLVDDDFRRLDPPIMAVFPCDLDCSLVGFKPRIAKKDIGHSRTFDQFAGEGFGQRVLEQIGMMNQPTHLIAQRLDEAWMSVAQCVDRNPGERVEIGLARCIK